MRATKRREVGRAVAWSRHGRASAGTSATKTPARAYNRLEARLARLMDDWGLDYQWQFRLGRYVYDFLLPDRALVEVHGTYWHADPRVYHPSSLTAKQRKQLLRDFDKRRFAAERGYRLKVVWELDLDRDTVGRRDLA